MTRKVLVRGIDLPFNENADGTWSITMTPDTSSAGVSNHFEVGTNGRRNAGVLHRSNVSAADVVAAPGSLTVSAATVTGGTLANSQHNAAVAAVKLQAGSAHILGVTTVSTGNATPAGGSDSGIRIAWASVTNADAYLIFMSTDANPKLAAYVTEAQRAAGGIVSAFGTVGAGGTAGAIDLGAMGTGLAANHAAFAQNTALLPDKIASPINCAGYSVAFIHTRIRPSKTTVWSALQALTLIPFLRSQETSADWFPLAGISYSVLTAVDKPFSQVSTVTLNGAPNLVVAAAVVTQCAFDCWVELA